MVGAPNLYLREDEGGTFATKLVATLAAADTRAEFGIAPLRVVAPEPFKRGVRVIPDGTAIVFTSSASLTGYDNKGVGEGLPGIELYRYEATSGDLTCVSCNPSGARPQTREVKGVNTGLPVIAAQMPGWENQSFAPRALSDNGKRFFFDSFDALLPRDTNGAEDVYEWEAADSKSECEAKGADLYVASAGGCLSLITTGQNPNDSEVIDATPSGSDVFIKTSSSLLPQDPGLVDIYDAREGGGLPPPPGRRRAVKGKPARGHRPRPTTRPPPRLPSTAPATSGKARHPNTAASRARSVAKGRCGPKQSHKRTKRAKHNGRAGR